MYILPHTNTAPRPGDVQVVVRVTYDCHLWPPEFTGGIDIIQGEPATTRLLLTLFLALHSSVHSLND